MPFKVVQTVENGELCLSIVPARWEDKGLLRWPKKSVVARLCRDEESCPGATWETLNCVLKREFHSFFEAEKELQRMEAIEDTELDENDIPEPQTKKVCRKNVAKRPLDPVDFNDFLTNPQKANCTEKEISMTGDKVLYVEDSSVVYIEENIVNDVEMQPTEGYFPDNTASDTKDIVMDNIHPGVTSMASQQLIVKNQFKIMASLAKIITSVEVLTKKVLALEKNIQAGPQAPVICKAFKPVNSLEDLDRLEAELKDDNKMQRYVEQLRSICGTSGKSDGIDCAYRLIDYVATREMLNMCSWTGLAREHGETVEALPRGTNEDAGPSKIPLKFYLKFRELFCKVIRLADQDFSEASCEKFLKGVLKNSKQRLTSKVASTRKNRPKNLKYGSKKEEVFALLH